MKVRISKLPQAQTGGTAGRLVPQIPSGYIPYPEMGANYAHNPSAAGGNLHQAVPSSGSQGGVAYEQQMRNYLGQGNTVDQLVQKGYGTKQGLNKFSSSYKPSDDIVYTQKPSQPAQVKSPRVDQMKEGTDNILAYGMDNKPSFLMQYGLSHVPGQNGTDKNFMVQPVDNLWGKPVGNQFPVDRNYLDNEVLRGGNVNHNPMGLDSVRNAYFQAQQNSITHMKFGGLAQKGYALDRNDGYMDDSKNTDQGLRNQIRQVPRDQASIEAEQGETALVPTGDDNQLALMGIGGKKHYAGGTALNLDPGSFIFSDTSKMRIGGPDLAQFGKSENTKKKFTPAALSKQYDINPFIDKQKNESDDKFAQNTAELMQDNYRQKLGALADYQEKMKGNASPGVSQQISQDGQTPKARYGGNFSMPQYQEGGQNTPNYDPFGVQDMFSRQNPNTFPYAPNNITPYAGDQYNNKGNGSMYSAKQLGDKLRSFGYPGTPLTGDAANQHAQQWTYNNVPGAKERIDAAYANTPKTIAGTPANGVFDTKWGYRSDVGLFGDGSISNNVNASTVDGTPAVSTSPAVAVTPGTVAGGTTNNTGKDLNFSNTPQPSVGPNFLNMMGLANAIGQYSPRIPPHYLPNFVQTSNPAFADNRAEIQQAQSMAATNNYTNMMTGNGAVARANGIYNFGHTFDAINQSNERTQNSNIGIQNQWNASRDAVMNQNAAMNNTAVGKYLTERDILNSNTAKEKQLRKNNILGQVEGTYDNIAHMNALNARYPNFKATGSMWNVNYVPLAAGTDMFGGNGQTVQSGHAEDLATIKKLMNDQHWTMEQAMGFMKMGYERTKSVYNPQTGMETSRTKTSQDRNEN